MANSQIVNLLKTPGGNPTYPFPDIDSTNPCPQYLLTTPSIAGAYTINTVVPLPGNGNTTTGGATANAAVMVEFWTGNNKQSALIYVSQTLATIQGDT